MPQRPHPSLLFQHGEVRDFLTALDVNMAQERWEFDQFTELCRQNHKPGDYDERQRFWQAQKHTQEMTEKARSIYKEVVEAAHKEAARQMRETGDRLLCALAEGLESGSYDHLAI